MAKVATPSGGRGVVTVELRFGLAKRGIHVWPSVKLAIGHMIAEVKDGMVVMFLSFGERKRRVLVGTDYVGEGM
jgi:hypothetical protein